MKPSHDMMRAFGCLCFMSTLKRERIKFHPRANPCLFLGYSTKQKGYKVYNFITKTISVSKDVHFYEHFFPYHHHGPTSLTKLFLPYNSEQRSTLVEDPSMDYLFNQL